MTAIDERHVFISFSSKDEKQARAVCDEMERRGLICWISSRDVRPGRNYQTEIIDAIRSASHLVLIFSLNASHSLEIPRELSLASKEQIPIVPLRVENIQPSGALEYTLATSQWVDAFQDWPGAMDKLAVGLDLAGAPKTTASPPAVRSGGKTYRLPLVIGVVVALLAIAGAGYFLSRQPASQPQPVAATAQPGPVTTAISAVEKVAKGLDCAQVSIGSGAGDVIALNGFVKSAEDEQRLLAAAPGAKFQNEIDVAPWPFCELRGLPQALGAVDDIAIDINHPDGRYAIGDDLTGSFIPGGQSKVWVQADLFQFDGAVFHVLPLPGQVRVAKPGEKVAIGGPKGSDTAIEAGEPAGDLILVVIASDKPLPAPTRSDEVAKTYLPKLRQTLAALDATLSISMRKITVIRKRP